MFMIIGSFVGGVIADAYSVHACASLSALLSFAMAMIDFFILLPMLNGLQSDSVAVSAVGKAKKEEKGAAGLSSMSLRGGFAASMSSLSETMRVLQHRNVTKLVAFQILAGFGLSLYQSTFSLMFKERLGLEAQSVSFLVSFSALISTISNAVLIGYARKLFKNNDVRVIQLSCIVLAFCFSVLGYLCSEGHSAELVGGGGSVGGGLLNCIIILAVPQGIASAFLYLLMASVIKGAALTEDVGKAISLSHASRALLGVITPTVGTQLIAGIGYSSIGWCASLSLMVALWFSLSVFSR